MLEALGPERNSVRKYLKMELNQAFVISLKSSKAKHLKFPCSSCAARILLFYL